MNIKNLLIIDDKHLTYKINQTDMLTKYKYLTCYLNQLSCGEIVPNNLYVFQVELEINNTQSNDENKFNEIDYFKILAGDKVNDVVVKILYCNSTFKIEDDMQTYILEIKKKIDELYCNKEETLILLDAKLIDIENIEEETAKLATSFSRELYQELNSGTVPYNVIYYSSYSHSIYTYSQQNDEDYKLYSSMADISWYDLRTTARRIFGAYEKLKEKHKEN